MSTETAPPPGDADVLVAAEQAVNAYLADDPAALLARAQLATMWPDLAGHLDLLAGVYETVAVSRDPKMVAAIAEADSKGESR